MQLGELLLMGKCAPHMTKTTGNRMHPLLVYEFGKLLQHQRVILANQRNVAVAVSGGIDSMALLFLLHRWIQLQQLGVVVHGITIDHQLRSSSGDEALKVANIVSTFATRLFVDSCCLNL